jgi:CDP-paratose 2-epimerase
MEMLTEISRLTGIDLNLRYKKVRPGDQALYIADTAKLSGATGWKPRRNLADTLESILDFWNRNHAKVHPGIAAESHAPALQGEVA